MKAITQTFRMFLLLGVVMAANNSFAQTTNTEKSSEQVLTRSTTEKREEKIISGCTELTRVTPANTVQQGEQTVSSGETAQPDGKLISGCTELTRVKSVKRNPGNVNNTQVTGKQ